MLPARKFVVNRQQIFLLVTWNLLNYPRFRGYSVTVKHKLLIAASIIIASSLMPTIVVAAPINGNEQLRAYARRRYFDNTNGIVATKAVLNGGWNQLSTGPVSGSPRGLVFISKDVWLRLDQFGSIPTAAGCWIEAMITDTKMTSAYQATYQNPTTLSPDFRGYLIATQISNSPSATTGNMEYREYVVGSADPDPTAQTGGTVEIIKTPGSTNSYNVNINNVNQLNLLNVTCRKINNAIGNINQGYPAIGGERATWGIESNDTANTFTSGTSMDVLLKRGTATQYSIPSSADANVQDAPPSWSTGYSTVNGRVTMTR
jgi:hypothetical protein